MDTLPFVEYVREDKSKYPTASSKGYHDPDGDFLVGDSGGFLFNINFYFVNTYLLRTSAIYYEKFNKYVDAPYDTPPHRRFRVQEENRRRNGYVAKCKLPYQYKRMYDEYIKRGEIKKANSLVKPLRITGEHYNFINYGLMSKLDEKSVIVSENGNVTGKKKEGIPNFFGSQYWWYKSKEFSKNNGYHIIGGKARRAGFSYMEAVGSASTINLTPSATVIHAASELKYLTEGRSITRMAKMQIEHYELRTPFKRGVISHKITDIYLGFKRKDNSNDGYQSHILSLATDNNSEVAIGKDAVEIKCEEMSIFDNFDEFMKVTEPTTRTGSVTTGLIVAWGTGGSEDGNWETFEKNFYNPGGFNFMPFENVWDKDARDRVCGYFKSYVESLQGFTSDGRRALDADGNTDYDIAMQIIEEERAKAKRDAKTLHDYIIYCGQYANMPSESFSSTTDNLFASERLTNHINKVRHNPDFKFFTDGMPVEEGDKIIFKSNHKLHDEGIRTHPYIDSVPPSNVTDYFGCTRVFHMPYKDPKGIVPPEMYTISYDPVGIDKEDPNSKNSFNSITVWMQPNPYFRNVDKLRVANYFGRPPLMEQSDKIALLLCRMYGDYKGIMLAEVNRGETKSNFRKWGKLKLLDKEPVVVWDTKIKNKEASEYGINLGNDIRKLQGLKLLKHMLYMVVGKDDDGNEILFLETIPDLAFLLEIQKWRYDGNFDRISDAIIEAFKHKKLEITAANRLKRQKNIETYNKAAAKKAILNRAWF